MNKKRFKRIATWTVVPLMISIFALDIITVALGNSYRREYEIHSETFTYENGDDRIHFLNTANSDAILIESNGMFGLVDSGEGNSNPRRKTEYKGYEKEVIDYIKKVCRKDDGEVFLDFILATHCHYDHIGAFHALITDDLISIGKAYFKEFDPLVAKSYEVDSWKIGETYEQIISDLTARNVEIVSNLPIEPFQFGDFTIQFFNTVNSADAIGKGENAASIGVKLTKGEVSAFLAADITKSTGLEDSLSDEIGHVDILKIGHHGYYGSSSADFLRALTPKVAIVTNQLGKIYPNVKWNLTMVANVPIFATYDSNGLIAAISDSGEIVLTDDIHEY